VAYVDNDPVVALHGQALLASRDRVIMVHADLRKPASIMQHPDVLGLLDLAQPVALLCTSSLHFVPDEAGPHQIIAEYRDYLASGSYLAITHANVVAAEEDPNGDVGSATSVYSQASAQLHARSLPEIRRFFDGFDLIDPGSCGCWNGGTIPARRHRSACDRCAPEPDANPRSLLPLPGLT
jgi:hypothetical protein